MSTTKVDTYRKNWPRLGAVLAMAIGGATALGSKKLSTVQVLSAMNFVALLVHQYEEYQDPGYFPGQFNGGIFHSDQPRNYPLNAHAAMCINTAVGYPYYLAPVLFPKIKWLGLSPVVFGFSQALGTVWSSRESPAPNTVPGFWRRSCCTSRSASLTSRRSKPRGRSNAAPGSRPRP